MPQKQSLHHRWNCRGCQKAELFKQKSARSQTRMSRPRHRPSMTELKAQTAQFCRSQPSQSQLSGQRVLRSQKRALRRQRRSQPRMRIPLTIAWMRRKWRRHCGQWRKCSHLEGKARLEKLPRPLCHSRHLCGAKCQQFQHRQHGHFTRSPRRCPSHRWKTCRFHLSKCQRALSCFCSLGHVGDATIAGSNKKSRSNLCNIGVFHAALRRLFSYRRSQLHGNQPQEALAHLAPAQQRGELVES